MSQHDVEHRHVLRAFDIARTHVLADPFFRPDVDVRGWSLTMLRAARLLAHPDMESDELALLMSVDDAERFVRQEARQYCFWWSAEVIGRMADVLNEDRIPQKPKREPKPVPPELLSLPGLPRCGAKRPGMVDVSRRAVVTRPPRPRRIPVPWDPPEARLVSPSREQRPLPHTAYGDPGPGRSALDALRGVFTVEVRA